jgi:L-serine dehydratase
MSALEGREQYLFFGGAMPTPITTTLAELFKIGPGPSSSHTMAPMLAGYDFLQRIQALPSETRARAARIQVLLFGSLAATGVGHGTWPAIVAGLLGNHPTTCQIDILDQIEANEGKCFDLPVEADGSDNGLLRVFFSDIKAGYPENRKFPFSNTLIIELRSADSAEPALLEMEYYSVGGGFLQWKGWEPPKRAQARYSYSNMQEFKQVMEENNLSLPELMLQNEITLTGKSVAEVEGDLNQIIDSMCRTVEAGLRSRGVLPGSLRLGRKGADIMDKAMRKPQGVDRFLATLSARSFAASEENAAGHRIVTAPTAGGSGVMPALVYTLHNDEELPLPIIWEGLLAAALIGFLAKHNASIAGADVGCQGEIGVASAMGAAFLAQAKGHPVQIVENAAETAMEQHLGMTCDPVDGLVQIPCIERNAVSVVKSYVAYLIASSLPPGAYRVGLDAAIQAMEETGRDMCTKYKETSQGGLAVSVPEC